MDKPPTNLIIATLVELDPRMLIAPDGEQIQVSVQAICDLIANPPPMVKYYWPFRAEWQPIATAPTDGTVVDLWDSDDGRLADCFMTAGGWFRQYAESPENSFGVHGATITHWMPRATR